MKNLLTSKLFIIIASIGAVSGLGTLTVSNVINDEEGAAQDVEEFGYDDLKEIVGDIGGIAGTIKQKILDLLDGAKDDMGH